MLKSLATLAASAILLTACAAGPQRLPDRVIDRALANAPGQAQPSKVVAAEIAFSRAAREQGQWTAFREFAGPGAVIHGRNGPIDAGQWLAGRNDPAEAVQWGARTVWMSCDGALAISRGRFRDPAGMVGTFVTVWQRQGNDEYRWIYDVGAPDDPQPPPRPPTAPPSEDEIIVTGLSAIQGWVADCPRRGETIPAPPPLALADGLRHGVSMSRDGTLRWRWEHSGAGQRRIVAEHFHEGRWQVALDQAFPAGEDG